MNRRMLAGQNGLRLMMACALVLGWLWPALAGPESRAWLTAGLGSDPGLAKPPDRILPGPAVAEIDALIATLDDNSYPARKAAAEKLAAELTDTPSALLATARLKHQLDDPSVSCGARNAMHSLWQQARGVWLQSEAPARFATPSVSDELLDRWLDDLVLPLPELERRAHVVRVRVDNAKRELLDLLGCDGEVSRTRAAIEKRLAGTDDEVAQNRLAEIYDLTRPAMVAEFWKAGRHTGVQHLLIGIPNHSPNAQRASHFDRIDDHTAHCVSGNALSPGDYPVGVLFPHPGYEDSQFQLVNLPTPRKRMAYEYLLKIDETRRLTTLTERTLAGLSASGRQATPAELNMFRFLDHRAVSRYAGHYLLTVADQVAPPELGFGSYHALLCAVLAETGTQEAIPDLLRAIERGRILPPTADQPYRLSTIAALAIARRDPWPKVEAWLETLLSSDEPLSMAEGYEGRLGATAAAVLLERHAISPSVFGLERIEGETLLATGCVTYRFATPDNRAAVVRWWTRQKEQLAARPRRGS